MPRNYLKGKDAVANFGGVLAVEDGSWDHEVEFDEATNTTSKGWYSSVPTIQKVSGSLDCVYDGDTPPSFKAGDLVAGASLTVPGGPGFHGDVYIDKVSNKAVTVKGAVKFSFDFHSEEVVTLT